MNKYMKMAINEARKGITNNHGGPFGSVIVRDGKVIAKGKHDKLMTSCEYYRTLYQTEDNSN